MIKKFVKHCLTGKDNETFDIARVLWALGALSFLAFVGWTVYRSGAFDAQNFGTGFGLIMGSGGGSVWAKAKAEPEPETKNEL